MWLPVTMIAGSAEAHRFERQGGGWQRAAVDDRDALRRGAGGAGRSDPRAAVAQVAADEQRGPAARRWRRKARV